MVAIFGGQGNTDDYFEELRDLYQTYHVLVGDLIKFSAETLSELIRTTLEAEKVFTQGLNILEWLENPSNTPDKDYLLSIPISCPLIGVIQLAHYVVTAKLLGFTPGELRSYLKGATGHSQGLVTAVAIAETDSWESFFVSVRKAITVLFFIGVRCYEAYPNTSYHHPSWKIPWKTMKVFHLQCCPFPI